MADMDVAVWLALPAGWKLGSVEDRKLGLQILLSLE